MGANLDEALKDSEYAENVGVAANVEEVPWLVFKFYYKSAGRLRSLHFKFVFDLS